MVFPVLLAVSVVPDLSQHNTLLLLQADLEMVVLLHLQTNMEYLVLPAASVPAILCRLSTELLVLQVDLEVPVLYPFLAGLVALARFHLNTVPLVPQANLGVPALCQRSMVLHQVLADSMPQVHSTPLAEDTLLQEEDTMPKKMILP
jgi:hypothetical protein